MMSDTFLPSILPLIGVVIGWLLNEAASFFRGRSNDRKTIGRAINKLLGLRRAIQEILTTIHTVDQLYKVGESSEEIKKFAARLEIEGLKIIEENHDSLLNDIAAFDPILSFEVGHEIHGISFMCKNAIDHAIFGNHSHEKWRELFKETNEFSQRELIKALEGFILRLSYKKSLILYYRMKKYFRNDEFDTRFVGDHVGPLHEIIKGMESALKKPNNRSLTTRQEIENKS